MIQDHHLNSKNNNLLVLGHCEERNGYIAHNYRGLDRNYLQIPIEYYHPNEEIYNLFWEYESKTEDDIYLHDIDFANKLKQVYNKHYPEDNREVVEVIFENVMPYYDGQVVGYDICSGYYSSILNIILHYSNLAPEYKFNFLPEFHVQLKELAFEAVIHLNENQLFSSYETAEYYMFKIGEIHHNFNCFPKHHFFSVVKVNIVSI